MDYTAAKSLQSCPNLCDPIDGSPPGSPVPGILQARTLEWLAISFSSAWKWKVKVKSLSRVRLFTTPWTAAYQAPPSMGFSRQEYWSGVPLPSPMDYTDHGILQARILEWVAFPFSRGSSQPRNRTQISCIAGRFFTSWATREAPRILEWVAYPYFSRSSQPRYQTRVSCIAGRCYTNWVMRETLPLW